MLPTPSPKHCAHSPREALGGPWQGLSVFSALMDWCIFTSFSVWYFFKSTFRPWVKNESLPTAQDHNLRRERSNMKLLYELSPHLSPSAPWRREGSGAVIHLFPSCVTAGRHTRPRRWTLCLQPSLLSSTVISRMPLRPLCH